MAYLLAEHARLLCAWNGYIDADTNGDQICKHQPPNPQLTIFATNLPLESPGLSACAAGLGKVVLSKYGYGGDVIMGWCSHAFNICADASD